MTAWRIFNASWVNRALVVGGVAVVGLVLFAWYSKDLLSLQIFGMAITIYIALLVMLKSIFEVRLATRTQIQAMSESTRQQIQTMKAEFQRTVASLDSIVGELSRLSIAMTQVAEETRAVKVAATQQLERDARAEQARVQRLRPKLYATITKTGFLAAFNLGRYQILLENLGPEATDIAVTSSTFNPATKRMEPQVRQAPLLRAGQPVSVDFGGILEVNSVAEVIELSVELRDIDKRVYRGHAVIPLHYRDPVPLDLVEDSE